MKDVKRKSYLQEKNVAKCFHAKTTIASGAVWSMKGDVRNEKFLIECKTTNKKFYTVTIKVWEKILKEAIKDHLRVPLLVIDIVNIRYVVFNPKDLEKDISIKIIDKRNVTGSFRIKYEDSPDIYGFQIQTSENIYSLAVCTYDFFYDYYMEEI